jgi:hypothetical protein
MASRLRKFIESVVFAGMQPGKGRTESRWMRFLGPLREPVDRLISGGGNQDPLYLSSRTFGQKLLDFLKVSLPLAVVVGGIVFAFQSYHREDKPPEILSDAERAAKMLPDSLNKPIHVDTNTEVEVEEVFIDHTGSDKLVGKLHNNTNREIENGYVDFTLTGDTGTQVGSVMVRVKNLAAGGSMPFSEPIGEKDAKFALVRGVHTQ